MSTRVPHRESLSREGRSMVDRWLVAHSVLCTDKAVVVKGGGIIRQMISGAITTCRVPYRGVEVPVFKPRKNSVGDDRELVQLERSQLMEAFRLQDGTPRSTNLTWQIRTEHVGRYRRRKRSTASTSVAAETLKHPRVGFFTDRSHLPRASSHWGRVDFGTSCARAKGE